MWGLGHKVRKNAAVGKIYLRAHGMLWR